MHELFHTSVPAFSYFASKTREILAWLGDTRECAVTLDAGPNVHLLVPTTRAHLLRQKVEAAFPGLVILEDRQGKGACDVVTL